MLRLCAVFNGRCLSDRRKMIRRRVISLVDKQRIVAAYNNPEADYVEVAETLGILRGTAWSIVRRYLDDGEVVVRKRGGGRRQIGDQQMIDCLVETVGQHPTFTLSQLNHELQLQLPWKPHVSDSTIHRLLRGQLITMKKLETPPAERNRQDVKEARKAHAEWVVGQDPHLVYIDESGFNLWLNRTRGRSARGHRAQRIVGARRSPNFTLILAVSPRLGRVHHSIHNGGTTAEVFGNFLRDLRQHLHEPVTLLLDNAPCHRGAMDIFDGDVQVNLRYLPPYSPFLNVAENCFSVWKAGLRRQLEEVRDQLLQQPFAQQMATLTQLAEQNMEAITQAVCAASHQRTRQIFPACIEMQDIVDDHA